MAIGFWMTVEEAQPVKSIRVFVTYEALAQIEPSQPRDRQAAVDTFNKHRARIETAASQKFDAKGVDDGEHEGQPILMVRMDDLQ